MYRWLILSIRPTLGTRTLRRGSHTAQYAAAVFFVAIGSVGRGTPAAFSGCLSGRTGATAFLGGCRGGWSEYCCCCVVDVVVRELWTVHRCIALLKILWIKTPLRRNHNFFNEKMFFYLSVSERKLSRALHNTSERI